MVGHFFLIFMSQGQGANISCSRTQHSDSAGDPWSTNWPTVLHASSCDFSAIVKKTKPISDQPARPCSLTRACLHKCRNKRTCRKCNLRENELVSRIPLEQWPVVFTDQFTCFRHPFFSVEYNTNLKNNNAGPGVIRHFYAQINWAWSFNCSWKLKCLKIRIFLAFLVPKGANLYL